MTDKLNRCYFQAASAGTGDFVYASTVAGYASPTDAGAVDTHEFACIAENGSPPTEWELVIGAYDAGTGTIARTTIVDSSNAGAAVTFSAAPKVRMGVPLAADFGADPSTLPDLANDPDTTTGLTYGYKAGRINFGGSVIEVDAGTIDLPDDTITAVFYNVNSDDGVQSSFLSPPDSIGGIYAMAVVTTAGGAITDIADRRAFATLTYGSFSKIITDGAVSGDTGLDIAVGTFSINTPAGAGLGPVSTPTLDDDATNYVEAHADGTVTSNTSGFTPGLLPLAQVDTSGGEIVNIADVRPAFFLGSTVGFTGSFTALSGETVTVVNGMIVSAVV